MNARQRATDHPNGRADTGDPARGLYGANTLDRFWGLAADVPQATWAAAALAAADILPSGREVLASGGWPGLMEHVLGEGQFGPGRYCLSRTKRVYYALRPLLPRRLTAVARNRLTAQPAAAFPLAWPIEDRYVRFLYDIRDRVAAGRPGPRSGGGLAGRPGVWPAGNDYAFVLTHDVERAGGLAFVRQVADLDERYGFRSSFNFVVEDYAVDPALAAELVDRGFEVGIHGLKHDGSLFASQVGFARAAERIGHHARALGAVGFRSPATHRNPRWMQRLPIEYDASFFDTDPYEVMPGGTMSIWPFFCGRFVELPYTLAQDHTLLVVLGQQTPQVWADKVDFIARWGGMALLNAHPDYLREPACWRVYEEFLQHMAQRRQQAPFWHALPREVARWWRRRAGEPAAASPADAAVQGSVGAGQGGSSEPGAAREEL